MDDKLIELLAKHTQKTDDGLYHFEPSIYTDPDFLKKLEDIIPKRFDKYCILCRFREKMPSRGMYFPAEEDLIDNFINILYQKKSKLDNGNFVLYVMILIIIVISAIVMFAVGYQRGHSFKE